MNPYSEKYTANCIQVLEFKIVDMEAEDSSKFDSIIYYIRLLFLVTMWGFVNKVGSASCLAGIY